MSDSPNSLSLDGGSKKFISMSAIPQVVHMSKWPMYIALGGFAAMIIVLIYSISFKEQNRKVEDTQKKEEIAEPTKPVWNMNRGGLAAEDRDKEPISGVAQPDLPPPPPQGDLKERIEVKQTEPPDPYLENIRRMRNQSYMTALSSPLVVKRGQHAEEAQRRNAQESTQRPQDDYVSSRLSAVLNGNHPEVQDPNNTYNPAADKDKEQFFDRNNQNGSKWSLNEVRTPGQKYELKTGAVIPGVMVTGINSDLPGNLIAQVSQNVYDSATGRYLLIPQGTKVYGVYDSRVVYGQERCLIAWNRLIFPDGSSITLGAMPGADMAGFAGFHDDVNNHYFRIFGSAVLMSLVTGGMAYAMDSAQNDNMNSNNGTSMTQEMTAALAQQLGQTTTSLLQKNLNIKPTLEIRPGYQFNLVITKDIAFQQPYTRWRR